MAVSTVYLSRLLGVVLLIAAALMLIDKKYSDRWQPSRSGTTGLRPWCSASSGWWSAPGLC